MPSARISSDGNGTYLFINDVHIWINDEDGYPWFSYFSLGKESDTVTAFKALMDADVHSIEASTVKASHSLNIESDINGGFFIFP